MKQAKIGNRVIVIAGTTPATDKTANREPTHQRATPQRIVLIRNGELVRSRPGR